MLQVTSPIRFIAFIAVIALIIAGVVVAARWGSNSIQKSGQLEIAQGNSAKVIWQKLVDEGFSENALPWQYYGWRLDAAPKIQAGIYQLERGEAIPDVIRRFIEGDVTPDELSITFPEGFTVRQMAARTEARGIGTEGDFLAAAKPENHVDQYPFLSNIPSSRDLEGYLFPDTYQVFEDDTPEDVIRRMLANFNRKFTDDLRREAEAQGRTLDEIVSMASIIEREVLTDDDMAVVSGILWSRFDDGVGLGADATVRYALDKWDGPLTLQDLASNSPYNTRKFRGLPPGPISNPGLRALAAAVRSEPSEFYYYLSAPSGETIFSRTLDEHNANKARYLQ